VDGFGDAGDGDVTVGVLVDERNRAAQRVGMGVALVGDGWVGQGVVREYR
jgi:hypothetical protein